MSDLSELAEVIQAFNTERDWHQFHDAKSLTLALAGEIGELAELLQWVPASTVRTDVRVGVLQKRLGEEMADILVYLVMLADEAGIDLVATAKSKLAEAARRFLPTDYYGRAPSKLR